MNEMNTSIAVNNGSLLTVFKEGTENIFLCPIDMRHVKRVYLFCVEVVQVKPAEAKFLATVVR